MPMSALVNKDRVGERRVAVGGDQKGAVVQLNLSDPEVVEQIDEQDL